jgi:hypothetical protein
VGAAPTEKQPLRDVDHDLISAGHPRLQFEFGTYRANMPAHWRQRKQAETDVWAAGQRATAEAALALLAYRAKTGPWPEFAEYDCFACHHSLTQPTWRQTGEPRRPPGMIPWGSWYFAMIPQGGDLAVLKTHMQQRVPNRGEIAAKADRALAELRNINLKLDRNRLCEIVNDKNLMVGWDGIEQTYLALHALEAAKPEAKLRSALVELTPLRAYPPGFAGPPSLFNDKNAAFDPQAIVERLKDALANVE